jgi:uncharacterized membrane protein YhaH (DUF805 family)
MIDQEKLKNIEELHRLKTEGILTEAEFDKAKADLLNGPQRPKPAARLPVAVQGPTGLPGDEQFFEWAMLPLKRYADFTGRSTRKEYWLFTAFAGVIIASLAVLWVGDTNGFGATGPFGSLMMVLLLLFLVGTLLPTFAVQVRRFHDQDWAGWFVLLNLIPYVGWLIVMLLMLREGTPGENRFGPNPLAPEVGNAPFQSIKEEVQ